MSDAARAAVRDFLKRERDRQTAFLASMVRVPSDNPPGDCRPHAEHAARELEALGLKVERYPVPDAVVKQHGMKSCTNLVMRERFGPGPTIACNAHGDVVPPGGGWSVDPYSAEDRDGRMYGRGVAVSKSDFATYTWALLALKAAGVALNGLDRTAFHVRRRGGRRDGSGVAAEGGHREARLRDLRRVLLRRHRRRTTAACISRSRWSASPATPPSPTRATMRSKRRRRSSGTSTPTARPSRAHESTVPGIGHPTLVVGLIQGGINTNVVPDRVVFRLDRRVIPDENPADAERVLTRADPQVGRGVERHPLRRAAHPACQAVRAASGAGAYGRTRSRRMPARCWASR